jgi:L-lactate utilization protein LutC
LRKEKSPNDDSSALDDVPASVREQNRNTKIKSFKKKMAKLSNAKREALLQEANALLVDMADALVTKNNKKVRIEEEDEEEAGWAELLDNTHTPTASPKSKPKKKKTAQDEELDRTLAHCTVQRFAGCSVPSSFSM